MPGNDVDPDEPAIVVLMLSGGETLEAFAVSEATSVLRALAKRVSTLAHRRKGSRFEDVPVGDLVVGDEVSILPTKSVQLTAKSFMVMAAWTSPI